MLMASSPTLDFQDGVRYAYIYVRVIAPRRVVQGNKLIFS